MTNRDTHAPYSTPAELGAQALAAIRAGEIAEAFAVLNLRDLKLVAVDDQDLTEFDMPPGDYLLLRLADHVNGAPGVHQVLLGEGGDAH